MKFLILYFFIISLVFSFSLKYIQNNNNKYLSPLPKIDISNNNTYKGRYFNGSLIINDYHNYSNIFRKPDYEPEIDYSYFKSLKKHKFEDKITNDDLNILNYYKTYANEDHVCNFNKAVIVEKINFLREKHGEKKLKWNYLLESNARSLTQDLTKKNCPLKSYDEKAYGTLILNGFGEIFTEEEVIEHFYKGVYSFSFKNFKENDFRYNYFDFAQILWNSTNTFGCSKACCLSNQIWVCLFNPAAIPYNLTLFKENVLPPTKIYELNYK